MHRRALVLLPLAFSFFAPACGEATATSGTGGTSTDVPSATSVGAGGAGGVAVTGDGGGGGGEGGAGGTPTFCKPGSSRPCYDGPPGTEGVGICHAGTETCNAQGSAYARCAGETTPEPAENCTNDLDVKCDRKVNAGCACTAGQVSPCYEGPTGTEGVGTCKAGTQTCSAGGQSFGMCTGDVLPTPEDCSQDIDSDCDGSICGEALWSEELGGSTNQYVYRVVADAAGNLTLAGAFQGTMTLGTITLVSAGGKDAFVARFDPTGKVVWARGFGSPGDDRAEDVAVNAQGTVVIAGTSGGTFTLDGITLVNQGEDDAYVLQLDAAGTAAWGKDFGDPLDQEAHGCAIDAQGSVFVTGGFWGSVDFGNGMPVTSQGNEDLFLVKLDGAGDLQWVKTFGDALAQEGHRLITDPFLNVVVVGDYDGVFLTCTSSAGQTIWANTYGSAGTASGAALAVDSLNDLLVTGSYTAPLSFGGPMLGNAAVESVFVTQLTAGGSFLWSLGAGTSGSNFGTGIAVDPSDNVYVTGWTGAADFGGGPVTGDAFLAALDASGNYRWSRGYGTGAVEGCEDVASAPSAGLFLACDNASVMDFGAGPLTATGGDNVTLASIAPE